MGVGQLGKEFFDNKVILSWCSSGLGKTFADYYNKGAKVIVCSRRNKFKNKFYKNYKNFTIINLILTILIE